MADASTIAPPGTPLTPAERRALEARERVDTDAEAAAVLGISKWTLRSQLANARSRLGVRSTRRAVAAPWVLSDPGTRPAKPPPRVMRSADPLPRPARTGPVAEASDGELAILRVLARPGGSYAAAAAELGATEPTIRRRLHAMYGRLGVSSGVQAMAAVWDRIVEKYCFTCERAFETDPRDHERSTRHRLLSSIAVTATGCWEWTRYRLPSGYGRVYVDGRMENAHRVSYEEFVGPIPDGSHVLHACDNPPCINPAHLRPGTNIENVRDRQARRARPRAG